MAAGVTDRLWKCPSFGTGVRKSGVSYPEEMKDKDWEARFRISDAKPWPRWILWFLILLIPIPSEPAWLWWLLVGIGATVLFVILGKPENSK